MHVPPLPVKRQSRGTAVDVVKVRIRVYYEDISGVARAIRGTEAMVFANDRVLDRMVSFMRMGEAFHEQRRRTNRLPDEVEFYRRWKATEGGGATN